MKIKYIEQAVISGLKHLLVDLPQNQTMVLSSYLKKIFYFISKTQHFFRKNILIHYTFR